MRRSITEGEGWLEFTAKFGIITPPFAERARDFVERRTHGELTTPFVLRPNAEPPDGPRLR